ncbi:hypothetical protein TNCV_3536801 [Trichonephila clavipes]|uniref:Uncharacterized protein n=1 Tax=Trichonephila clavipes TaxID=2585209 RepID=A0A8X6VWX2_TRICX|nr:hypothetical protein TNCV_3536801 [Trichonephila clavipes]
MDSLEPVTCIPLIRSHCRLQRQWCQELTGGFSDDLLYFLRKVGSALVPVKPKCWPEKAGALLWLSQTHCPLRSHLI